MDAAQREELLQELLRKEQETADLNRSLLQAASVGQDLLEENERLRKLVESLQMRPRARVQTDTSDASTSYAAASFSTALHRRRATSQEEPDIAKHQSAGTQRSRAATEDSNWGCEGRERREFEEERRALRRTIAELQDKLETERGARQSAHIADAARERSFAKVAASAKAQVEIALGTAGPLCDIEEHVRSSLRLEFQEEIDTLVHSSEARERESAWLRSELQQSSTALGKSNQKVVEMMAQNSRYCQRLQEVQAARDEDRRKDELDDIRQSAIKMRQSRKPSMVRPNITSLGGSLLEDEVELLREERAELFDEVDELRSRLEEVQSAHDAAMALQRAGGSGDAAAGESLGARQARKEAEDEKAGVKEADQFLAGVLSAFMCCSTKERPHGSDNRKLLMLRESRLVAEDIQSEGAVPESVGQRSSS